MRVLQICPAAVILRQRQRRSCVKKIKHLHFRLFSDAWYINDKSSLIQLGSYLVFKTYESCKVTFLDFLYCLYLKRILLKGTRTNLWCFVWFSTDICCMDLFLVCRRNVLSLHPWGLFCPIKLNMKYLDLYVYWVTQQNTLCVENLVLNSPDSDTEDTCLSCFFHFFYFHWWGIKYFHGRTTHYTSC